MTVEHDAIQAVVDGVDEVARQQEAKWGVGRLELLVSDEMREKFRRQLHRFNEAITVSDVERVRQSGAAMRRAWEALDRMATDAGDKPIDPEVWEIGLPNGRVIALCRTIPDAFAVSRAGRYIDVWTAEEIVRLIENFPEIALAKETFPGALIESARSKKPSGPIEESEYEEFEDREYESIPEGVRF